MAVSNPQCPQRCRGAGRLATPTGRRRSSTFGDEVRVSLLLEAAENTRAHHLLSLIASTGLRKGEALALRWVDVELGAEHPQLRVRGTLARDVNALHHTTWAPKWLISPPARLPRVRGAVACPGHRLTDAQLVTLMTLSSVTGSSPVSPTFITAGQHRYWLENGFAAGNERGTIMSRA